MTNHVLDDGRKVEKAGLGNVLVIGEFDQVAGERDIRSPQGEDFAAGKNGRWGGPENIGPRSNQRIG
jgi:hypothetical protein